MWRALNTMKLLPHMLMEVLTPKYTGFSLYGNFEANGELHIESAHGFVNAAGKSDLTYAITGFRTADVPSADQGNPGQG